MFLNAGLTNDHVEVVCAALHLVHEEELSHLFLTCNDLQTILLNLLLEEMFSTRSDVVYWERFRKGSYWEILLSRMNSRAFNWVFPRSDNVETLFRSPNDLIHYIESLRGDFHSLAIFLAKLNHAGANLKNIYMEIQKRHLFQHPMHLSIAAGNSASSMALEAEQYREDNDNFMDNNVHITKEIVAFTKFSLQQFILDITQALHTHMPKAAVQELALAHYGNYDMIVQADVAQWQHGLDALVLNILERPSYDVSSQVYYIVVLYFRSCL